MHRRLHRTAIGRYQMEVISGLLYLIVPQHLAEPALSDDPYDSEDLPDTLGIEFTREETQELIRLVRSIRLMELETQPKFPVHANISMDDITKQLQSTFHFVSELLLACNHFHAQGNEREADMFINLIRKYVVGHQIVFSHEQQSYILLPYTTEKNEPSSNIGPKQEGV